jgi:hypothetical protein
LREDDGIACIAFRGLNNVEPAIFLKEIQPYVECIGALRRL